jgi:integrase
MPRKGATPGLRQLPSGRWQAVVDLSLPGEPRRQQRRSFPSRSAAEKWRRGVLAARDRGEGGGARTTARELCDRWLALPSSRRSPQTAHQYRSRLATHVLPWLGNVRLDRLTPLMVQRHFDKRREEGASPAMLNAARIALKGALDQAVVWGLVNQNAAERVELAGAPPKREPRALTPNEEAALLTAADLDPDGCIVRLLLTTGLRIGEALALSWEDVDLEAPAIVVRRHVVRPKARTAVIAAGAKSAKGSRTVAIGVDDVAALVRHRDRQRFRRERAGEAWGVRMGAYTIGSDVTDLVFDDGLGRLQDPGRVGRLLDRLAAAAGIKGGVSPHALRHSHATDLVAAGVPLPVIQERLGHASPAMVLRYAHGRAGGQQEALARVEAMRQRSG